MSPQGDDSGFDGSETETVTTDALAALESKLSALEDRRKEERFCWVLVSIIIVDCYIFLQSNNSAGPVAILVLEAVFLVVLAKICGVEEVGVLLDKAINAWRKDQ